MKKTRTLLLCDEDTDATAATAFFLRSAGFSVRTTHSSLEAVVLAERDRPDLILMELRMPWFDGAAACRQIRSKASLREIPVLLMSGLPEKQTLERSVGSGATGILPKPFDKDALVAAVRACFPEPAAATTA